MIRFLEHRIGDTRVIRLIIKWHNAGVMDEGQGSDTGMGTPQGAIASSISSKRSNWIGRQLPKGQEFRHWCRMAETGSSIFLRITDTPLNYGTIRRGIPKKGSGSAYPG